ncbi:MAG: heme lyase CcmF/NrfE family subunit [Gammaproteobacteria bacterium]|nr:heme lyase CcmF/NrfE family subunit [Gammaproteobacteria bacterium]
MIPELGHFALVLGLALALLQAGCSLVGAQRNDAIMVALGRRTAVLQFAVVLLAFVALTIAFLENDFSLLYVAQNSNSELPTLYRFAAVWGAHEGSLLLWILILAGWTYAVVLGSTRWEERFSGNVIGMLGLVSIGFMLFTLLTSNPFERLPFPPADGRDLNPILQDPALAIHPPMLYLGYVGFAVPFAFALAALLQKDNSVLWARRARPWTAAAWLSLTLGITLGSWWAYYELGWGGWWFWDPVENASFMPWLVGTALLHSLAVTEQRKAFVSWTVLLAIATFSLSLLGTFLVRSGVLVSVHAFASDPLRGVFILAFLLAVVGSALALYAWKAPQLPKGTGFKPWSRESFLLLNNLLLTVAAAAVLLGTLYPLFLDSLNLGKISVGPPYFNAIFVPLMVPLLAAVAIGPLVNWKKDKANENLRQLRWPAVISVVLLVFGITVAWGVAGVMVTLGLWLAFWVLASAFVDVLRRRRAGVSVPLRSWGMSLGHLGLGATALGIAAVSGYGLERDVVLAEGEPVPLGQYEFMLHDQGEIEGPNYTAIGADILVTREGSNVADLHSQKRVYRVQRNAMTEAGIDPGLWRDVYVALGEPLSETSWSGRIQVKPMVRWIWLGGLLMALGGLLAALDPRYRERSRDKAGQA